MCNRLKLGESVDRGRWGIPAELESRCSPTCSANEGAMLWPPELAVERVEFFVGFLEVLTELNHVDLVASTESIGEQDHLILGDLGKPGTDCNLDLLATLAVGRDPSTQCRQEWPVTGQYTEVTVDT